MNDFFKSLCQVYATLEVYPPETFENRVVIMQAYNNYLSMKGLWDEYSGYLNKHAKLNYSLVSGFAGI